jgi:hypothetical protein
MRRFHLLILLGLIPAFLTASLALARDKAPADRVHIITDQNKGEISFVIDGKAVMLLDAAGAHVEGDITYGGGLSDVGHGQLGKTAP